MCIIKDCSLDYKSYSHNLYDYGPFDSDKFLAEYAEVNISFLTD